MELLTFTEAMALLGVSRATLLRMVSEDPEKLGAVKAEDGHWRFQEANIRSLTQYCYTVPKAAEILRLDIKAVWQMINDGRIRFWRRRLGNNKSVYVSRSHVEELLGYTHDLNDVAISLGIDRRTLVAAVGGLNLRAVQLGRTWRLLEEDAQTLLDTFATEELMIFLKVSRSQLSRLQQQGVLTGFKLGLQRRFPKDQFRRLGLDSEVSLLVEKPRYAKQSVSYTIGNLVRYQVH